MGCGVNECSCGKGSVAGQPAAIRGVAQQYPEAGNEASSERQNTVVDGVCLKDANAGHYFAENELFGRNTSRSAFKQLAYRLDKWKAMCTYQKSNPSIPLHLRCR